ALRRHCAEDRVRWTESIRGRSAEPCDELQKLGPITLEIPWRRSSDTLLDFRHRLDPATRPRQWKAERHEANHGRHGPDDRCHRPFVQRHLERIAQMTDGLMRRHAAPLSNAVGSKPPDPGFEAGGRCRVETRGQHYTGALRLAAKPSRQLGNRGFHPSAETAARFDARRIVVIHWVSDLPRPSRAGRTGDTLA